MFGKILLTEEFYVTEDKQKKYSRQYREANKDKIRAMQKQYREENREKLNKYHKEYRETNREKRIEYSKEYYRKNIEKEKLRSHDKYYSYKEAYQRNHIRYRKTSDGKFKLIKATAKRRKLDFSISLEYYQEKIWNQKCSYCGSVDTNGGMDRVDSSLGYINDNVVSCCQICNTMKLDHSLDKFKKQIAIIYTYLNLQDEDHK